MSKNKSVPNAKKSTAVIKKTASSKTKNETPTVDGIEDKVPDPATVPSAPQLPDSPEEVKGHIDSVNPEPVTDTDIQTKDDMQPPHTSNPEPIKEHADESPNEVVEEEIEKTEVIESDDFSEFYPEEEHSFSDDVYSEVPPLETEEKLQPVASEWSKNAADFRKITGRKHTVNGTIYTGTKR